MYNQDSCCSEATGKSFYKEEYNMSLCYSFSFFSGKTYIVADSRSSITVKSSQFGDVIRTEVISDNYKKIAKLNVENRTIIMYSTGVNMFGKDKLEFTEYISRFSFPYNVPFESVAKVLFDSFYEINHDEGIRIRMYEYKENEGLKRAYFNTAVHSGPVIETIPFQNKGIDRRGDGDKLPLALFESFHFSLNELDKDDSLFVSETNQMFEKIKELGKITNNTVGGSIRIGKLTPKGFTWLQNGYEL